MKRRRQRLQRRSLVTMQTSGQHALLTPEATIEALAYLIANPVETGAVRFDKDWPGAHALRVHVGTRVIRVKRPRHRLEPVGPNPFGRARRACRSMGRKRA